MKRPLFVSCLAIVLLSTLSDLATEFVEIGRGLYVKDVSANGHVVVGTDSHGQVEAFVWSQANGVQRLGVLAGHEFSNGNGVCRGRRKIADFPAIIPPLLTWTAEPTKTRSAARMVMIGSRAAMATMWSKGSPAMMWSP